MKSMLKRTLCLLLALIMCVGLAAGAFAADSDGSGDGAGGNGGAGGTTDTPVDPPVNPPVNPPVDPPAETDPPEEPKLTQIELSEHEHEHDFFPKDTFSLTYTTTPSDYEIGVTWASSDPKVASVSVSEDGKTCKVEALSEGDADITVTAGELSDTCHVKVSKDGIASFKITGDALKSGVVTVTGKSTFTLTGIATTRSEGTREGANWYIDNPNIVSVDSRGVFTAKSAGATKVRAECPDDDAFSDTITVKVNDAPLKSLSITGSGLSGGKATLSVGGSLMLGAAKSPDNTFNEEGITWTSSNTDVATVSSKGAVSAVGRGTAKITASCGKISAAVTVTVNAPSGDISASAARGKDLSFSGIYSDLRSRYKASYSKNPADTAVVKFSSLGNSSYGTLYTTSSASKSVAKNTNYALSDVSKFVFTPNSVGSYEMSYTLTDGANTISGKITITVAGAKTKNITVRLEDDSTYIFSSNSTLDKVSAASAISSAIKDASGLNYSYIVFTSPSSASKKIGTLYPTSSKDYDLDDYSSYTSKSSGTSRQSPVSKLCFVPKTEGDYAIGYTAYDAGDAELCSGSLIIEVGASDSSTVTITLDDDRDYTFSDRTSKNKTSAASAIADAVEDETGKTYSYIRFGSVSSGSSVGTLYSSSNGGSVSSSREYGRSSSYSYTVNALYFVPAKAGTYVRSFTAYDSSDRVLLDGTLKIIVPGQSGSSTEMDIYYNTTTGSTLSFSDDVFASWFRQQKGSGYKLAYVTFDDISRDFGTFKLGKSSFVPGGGTEYYSDSYSGATNSSTKYIDEVKYTAGSSVGYVSVDFTCYGGTSSSSTSAKQSGTFCIYVTRDSVKTITCDVSSGKALTLDEGDFVSVYKNAMSSNSSSTRYYIELLEVPSKGTLYYNYSSSGKPGTKLTSSNFDDYRLYVNSSSSYDSVEDLTYVPANSTSGSGSVRYLAYSTDGDPMYVGSITFNYVQDKDTTASISCGADGYTFRLSDFYSSGDNDPVAYVTFRQPSSGELMINYVNGRGVPLDSTVRLYTTSPSSGAYPITALTYIPKAGFSGNVTVDYVAVTEAGKVQGGTLTISVSGKKSSSRFKDVNSSGSGAWASDSIDFAYKWGLVNGTGDDTFSPDDTMSRAMLVTVLYRAAGSPKVSGSCKFSDVPAGAYYYDAVIWASENGIVTGTSSTTFSPDRDVNREQVAAFLHRFAKYNGENVTSTGSLSGYTDHSSVSSYAIEPITWAVQRGYITSASATDKVLSPGGNATRAQVAVMVHRFLTY